MRCAGLAHGVGYPCTASSLLIWWSRATALLHVSLRLLACEDGHGDHLLRARQTKDQHRGTRCSEREAAVSGERGSETPHYRQGQLGRADDGEGFVGCVVQWTLARMAALCRGSHVKNILYYIISQKRQKIAFFLSNAPYISKKTIEWMALKYW